MRRLLALALGLAMACFPTRAVASSSWGSAGYGDPPGWCTNYSDMWVATVVTNDPHVGTNPEENTFYGFHPNPGYDDWYGYFYGDFRGSPGDASGWVKLLHENYPDHYHWNFATNGWLVHGHAKTCAEVVLHFANLLARESAAPLAVASREGGGVGLADGDFGSHAAVQEAVQPQVSSHF